MWSFTDICYTSLLKWVFNYKEIQVFCTRTQRTLKTISDGRQRCQSHSHSCPVRCLQPGNLLSIPLDNCFSPAVLFMFWDWIVWPKAKGSHIHRPVGLLQRFASELIISLRFGAHKANVRAMSAYFVETSHPLWRTCSAFFVKLIFHQWGLSPVYFPLPMELSHSSLWSLWL